MKKALSLFLSLIMVITSICLFPLESFASENSKNFKAQNKQKGCNNKLEKGFGIGLSNSVRHKQEV